MKEIVFQVEEALLDGGWIAHALGESIVTPANSVDELKSMIRNALHCHFDEETR